MITYDHIWSPCLEHCTKIYITSWSRYCWIHEFAYTAVPGDVDNSDIVGPIFINECTWMSHLDTPPGPTVFLAFQDQEVGLGVWYVLLWDWEVSGLRFSLVTSVKPARESVKGNGRKHWCFWSLCVLIRSVAVWGKKCGYGFFEWCYRFHGILWRLTPCKGETCRRGSRTHAWPSDAFGISWYFPLWSVVRRCHISAILAYIYWLIHTFFFGQVWLHYIHLPGHHCVVGYQMILVTGHISTFNPHGSQPESCLQSCNLRHILSLFILIYYIL